jgi:hypothetical protein
VSWWRYPRSRNAARLGFRQSAAASRRPAPDKRRRACASRRLRRRGRRWCSRAPGCASGSRPRLRGIPACGGPRRGSAGRGLRHGGRRWRAPAPASSRTWGACGLVRRTPSMQEAGAPPAHQMLVQPVTGRDGGGGEVLVVGIASTAGTHQLGRLAYLLVGSRSPNSRDTRGRQRTLCGWHPQTRTVSTKPLGGCQRQLHGTTSKSRRRRMRPSTAVESQGPGRSPHSTVQAALPPPGCSGPQVSVWRPAWSSGSLALSRSASTGGPSR